MSYAKSLLLPLALILAPCATADEPAKGHVEKYASRLFLANGSVVDVAGALTIAIPSGGTSDVVSVRMPSGNVLQASSRVDSVWDAFEVHVRSGETALTLRGTMGFGMHEKLPDGLMLRLKDTTYRWLAYPAGAGAEGSAAKLKMQAAVQKLPQDFLSDLAFLSALPAAGLDSSVLGLSFLYMTLTELQTEGPTPVSVVSTQKLDAEAAAKLIGSR